MRKAECEIDLRAAYADFPENPERVVTRCMRRFVSRFSVAIHNLQTFQSLELALKAAEALGPEHCVIDRQGLQIRNQQRNLLRDEE